MVGFNSTRASASQWQSWAISAPARHVHAFTYFLFHQTLKPWRTSVRLCTCPRCVCFILHHKSQQTWKASPWILYTTFYLPFHKFRFFFKKNGWMDTKDLSKKKEKKEKNLAIGKNILPFHSNLMSLQYHYVFIWFYLALFFLLCNWHKCILKGSSSGVNFSCYSFPSMHFVNDCAALE